jgi:hypothetical protein
VAPGRWLVTTVVDVTDPDSVRASDSEREAAVERLRAASVEGRLTFGELTTRTEAAYSAQTRGHRRSARPVFWDGARAAGACAADGLGIRRRRPARLVAR